MSRPIIIILIALSAFVAQAQDLCDLKGNIHNNLSYINHNIKALILSPDNCVLDYMDTLLQSYLTTKDTKYLDAIYAIEEVSDGYMSEHLVGIISEILMADFKGYALYLYSQSDGGKQKPNALYLYEGLAQAYWMLYRSSEEEALNDEDGAPYETELLAQYINRQDIPEEVKAYLIDSLSR